MQHNKQVEALQEGISVAVAAGIVHALFPLHRNTKRPVQSEWQLRPPYSEPELRRMVSEYDLGLRCGPFSGILAVDDDQPKHGNDGTADEPNIPEADRFVLPPSGFRTLSPLGSEHRYYHHIEGVINGAGKIAPFVDHRSSNGYVVWIGSGHPSSENLYTLIEDGELGTLPAELIERLTAKPPPRKRSAVVAAAGGSKYADAAFVRELDAVQAAPDGTRNDQLNRSAFSLGTLVGGGLLDENEVISALESCFPGERKALGTIQRGIAAGIEHPRGVPETTGPIIRGITHSVPDALPADLPGSEPTAERPDILLPGGYTTPLGQHAEQSNLGFVQDVTQALQPGAVYRRGGTPGGIVRDAFRSMNPHAAMFVVDRSVRTIVYRKRDKHEHSTSSLFRPMDLGSATRLVEFWSTDQSGAVRDLRAIVPHPCYTGPQWTPSQPGWNPSDDARGGIYVTHHDTIPRLTVGAAIELLSEAVCDFPWATHSDRTRFFGLLLTPIIRTAISGPVPLHIIGAPDVGAGKTLLASVVLGGIALGTPTPATALGENEEEIAKTILATVIQGRGIVNFDNLAGSVRSKSLAALVTGDTYEGRILGQSSTASVPHEITVVATGNNIQLSGDLARRTVAIELSEPPAGLIYTHPDLRAWIAKSRGRLLGALCALVSHWRDQGAPEGTLRLESFEAWAGAVSGVLEAAGLDDAGECVAARRSKSDTFGAEVLEFVRLWVEKYNSREVSALDLLALIDDAGLFLARLDSPSERGRKSKLGRLMAEISRRHGIQSRGVGKGKRARWWIG